MKNTLTVQISFSYQGNTYTPSATIDLDRYLTKNEPVPDFFPLIARANDIDAYSYQYEVMEMGQYQYLQATGLARQFCTPDSFDLAGFEAEWKQRDLEQKIADIAHKYMKVNDLSENDALKNALLQAYRLGSTNQHR